MLNSQESGSSKVLLIDDDKVLFELLRDYLKKHGFDLIHAATARTGLKMCIAESPRLIILDVMLPETDGFSVIQELRKTQKTPVIMLTARGETTDRILGLELGADDYLTKPFEPRELVARIKAILKRVGQGSDEKIISGDIMLDPVRRQVQIRDKALDLTTSEYDLLLAFLRNPGKKFTRDELLSHLRGQDIEAFGRSIDNLVSRLRKKLDHHIKAETIQTVWGTGYVFIEPPPSKKKR